MNVKFFVYPLPEWGGCKWNSMLAIFNIWPCGRSLPSPPWNRKAFIPELYLYRALFFWITGKEGEQFRNIQILTQKVWVRVLTRNRWPFEQGTLKRVYLKRYEFRSWASPLKGWGKQLPGIRRRRLCRVSGLEKNGDFSSRDTADSRRPRREGDKERNALTLLSSSLFLLGLLTGETQREWQRTENTSF